MDDSIIRLFADSALVRHFGALILVNGVMRNPYAHR